MKSSYTCYAACSFGLESCVKRELENCEGIRDVQSRDARVYFTADGEKGVAQACLRLSAADRVYIVLKEFRAATFDELFEGVKSIRWSDWLSKTSCFPVNGDSVQSVLKSVPDIQAISKKAVVESLSEVYGVRFFKESGSKVGIYVNLLRDTVSVTVNPCGIGLNRRGYRVKNGPAPLRETLASGLIDISRWRDRPFYDPMCGSGTIAIEAALRAVHRAPGLGRAFDAEDWGEDWKKAFDEERENARSEVLSVPMAPVFASDIDPKMVEMARFHARRAGVSSGIVFKTADIRDFAAESENGTVICNPPYAIRMGEERETRELYRAIGKTMEKFGNLRQYYICADERFESAFGRPADRKRKVYNGNIKCTYYQYFR